MFGLQAWVFRFGNVVGPRQTHGVLFDFIRRLRANPGQLAIKGDGQQSKPYVHVNDVLNAVWLAWQKSGEPFNYFNVATDDAASVSEIASLAASALGLSAVRFEYAGGARGWPGDVPVVRLDSAKMKTLGWRWRSETAFGPGRCGAGVSKRVSGRRWLFRFENRS